MQLKKELRSTSKPEFSRSGRHDATSASCLDSIRPRFPSVRACNHRSTSSVAQAQRFIPSDIPNVIYHTPSERCRLGARLASFLKGPAVSGLPRKKAKPATLAGDGFAYFAAGEAAGPLTGSRIT